MYIDGIMVVRLKVLELISEYKKERKLFLSRVIGSD